MRLLAATSFISPQMLSRNLSSNASILKVADSAQSISGDRTSHLPWHMPALVHVCSVDHAPLPAPEGTRRLVGLLRLEHVAMQGYRAS